jgi:hypothetical protein
LYGSHGATVTEVAGNNPEAAPITGRAQLSSTVVDIIVTDAVKTVPAYPVLLCHFDRESIIMRFGRNAAVKGCVENGNLGRTWKPLGSELDPPDIRRVVKRGQISVGPDPLQHARVDQVGLPEASAAMNHPVPDSFNGRKPSGKEGIKT